MNAKYNTKKMRERKIIPEIKTLESYVKRFYNSIGVGSAIFFNIFSNHNQRMLSTRRNLYNFTSL